MTPGEIATTYEFHGYGRLVLVRDISAAIRDAVSEAVAPWRSLTDEALQIVDASAPLHPDRARHWEQKRCELRDRQSRLLGVGRLER